MVYCPWSPNYWQFNCQILWAINLKVTLDVVTWDSRVIFLGLRIPEMNQNSQSTAVAHRLSQGEISGLGAGLNKGGHTGVFREFHGIPTMIINLPW